MQRLELEEYTPYPKNVRLDMAQREALKGAYRLKPSSYIGAVNIGDLAVVVRPKISIDRVMFLIAYAMDPNDWGRDSIGLACDDDILEAIALVFAHRTRQAIQRGLLRGYRREEDALNTVRGRIRFGDQIGRRFGIPLPIEVAFDEFTEDIEKNRLLKTAIHRLGHTFIRSEAARREVRRLRPAFTTVGLGSYRRGALPEVRYTRLDEHYRPAVELARLIIDNSSLELFHGEIAGAAFLLDMNKVFERFLYVALREALMDEIDLPGGQWKNKARLTLDEGCSISMEPDLSWWSLGQTKNGSRPLFVGDAKYKKLEPLVYKHADIYQMLAYCTAADLSSGMLIYAADKGEPVIHKVKHAGKTIEVSSLDLRGAPEAILYEVRLLAERIKAQTRTYSALPAA